MSLENIILIIIVVMLFVGISAISAKHDQQRWGSHDYDDNDWED